MLVEYGKLGHVGHFDSAEPLERNARIVVQTTRGRELARVLNPGAKLGDPAGLVLRRATPDDLLGEAEAQSRAEMLFHAAQARLAGEPVAVVDCELPLSHGGAVLHLLPLAACDLDGHLAALSLEFALPVRVLDVTLAPEPVPPAKSCGTGCGDCSSGGCSTKTGGCSGGCSRKQSHTPEALTDEFARLREAIEARARLPLN